MPKNYGQACPVAKALELVGDRWTLLIARDLLPGTRRFQDLLESLPGIAPNILSDRLKLMEAHGLLARRLYSDHPPRAEYTLTDQGLELRPVVRALGIWGARHLGSSWTFVHDSCGSNVEIAYYCPTCEATVAADQVKRRPTTAQRRPAAAPARPARARTRAVRRQPSH